MHLKLTVLGWLLNVAVASFGLSAVFGAIGRQRLARRFLSMGSILSAVALVRRGWSTGHVPMQNLFEVFMVMGALVDPMARACRRVLSRPGSGLDAWIGLLTLFPAAFVFSEAPRRLPPALRSPLFVPHVLVYLAAYVLLAKSAFLAAGAFGKAARSEQLEIERSSHALACWGFPLLTLGLLLGAWWGKLAWGDFWHWDPKEMWALATWLIYLAYFHVRSFSIRIRPRLQAALLMAGLASIILTVSWVNLSHLFAGLHSYAY